MASLAFCPSSKLVELLRTADPQKNMFVRVLSSARLAVGADPLKPSAIIDLSREAIIPFADSKILVPQEAAPDEIRETTSRATRRSGEYWYELKGKRTECHSLKELLALSLLSIEKAVPGTLDKLTHVKPRSRRIVARNPKDLFDKPHLAKDYAERLGKDGWYYGTNNSAAETANWLQRASEIAGFRWGAQFNTSLIPTIESLGL